MKKSKEFDMTAEKITVTIPHDLKQEQKKVIKIEV